MGPATKAHGKHMSQVCWCKLMEALFHHSLQSGHQMWLAAKWRFLAATIIYKLAIFQQAMFDYQMVGIPLKSMKYIPLSSPLLSIVAVIIKPSHDSPMIVQTWWNIINQIWVCLKMGYTPNYSHLVGKWSLTIGCKGTLFSDKPKYELKPLSDLVLSILRPRSSCVALAHGQCVDSDAHASLGVSAGQRVESPSGGYGAWSLFLRLNINFMGDFSH